MLNGYGNGGNRMENGSNLMENGSNGMENGSNGRIKETRCIRIRMENTMKDQNGKMVK